MRRNKVNIEFICPKEDFGIFPEPFPASKALPEWFRKLAPVDTSKVSVFTDGSTVKRCVPFGDAMSLGWVIPMAITVRFEIVGGFISIGCNYPKPMIHPHIPFQIAGTPYEGREPMKYNNPWMIKTSPGWSCLIVPLLNRPHILEFFSGVIDSDRLKMPTNFPFVMNATDGVHTIEQGEPLVQVIPFYRDDFSLNAIVRAETKEDAEQHDQHFRAALASNRWYVRNIRARRSREKG